MATADPTSPWGWKHRAPATVVLPGQPSLPSYSARRILVTSVAILLLLSVNYFGYSGNAVFFTILAAMIAWRPETAFQALLIGFLGLVTNNAFVPKTLTWTIARFLLLAVGLVRFSAVLAATKPGLLRELYYVALLGFITTAGVTSILTGYFVQISLSKLLSFTIGTTTVFAGYVVLRNLKWDPTEWLMGLCTTVLALSALSVALGVSRNYKGTDVSVVLWNGPFYHPNATGPIVSMLVILLVSIYLFSTRRGAWMAALIAVGLTVTVAATRSRTSIFVLVFGIALLVLFHLRQRKSRTGEVRSLVSRTGLLVQVAVVLFVLLALAVKGGGIGATVAEILMKSEGPADEFNVDAVLASRSDQIAWVYDSFLQSPWIGIGFEVARGEAFAENATLFSAPIEKCFLPLAVLDECGIIGAIPFVLFLLIFFATMWTRLNIPGFVLMAAFVVVNFGEVMLFSPAGHGGFAWLIVGSAMLCGDRFLSASPRRARHPGWTTLRAPTGMSRGVSTPIGPFGFSR